MPPQAPREEGMQGETWDGEALGEEVWNLGLQWFLN